MTEAFGIDLSTLIPLIPWVGWALAFVGWVVTLVYYYKAITVAKGAIFWWRYWLAEVTRYGHVPTEDSQEWANENAPDGRTVRDQLDAAEMLRRVNVEDPEATDTEADDEP